MKRRILLVNPPIYDFSAYDFWLKPYGMLTVSGYLRGKAEFVFFDYLDRTKAKKQLRSDKFGRGKYNFETISKPGCLADIPRSFQRFGQEREVFRQFLDDTPKCEIVFLQTTMTYWYPGYAEVIEDVRRYWPDSKIVLGGSYATVCKEHAKRLGADFVLAGLDLKELWEYIGIEGDLNQPALWEVYDGLAVGVLKLTDGCPFKCTYCSVPKVYKGFSARSTGRAIDELELLLKLGGKDVAFYDDALLFRAEEILVPFLKEVLKRDIKVNFHCPNALNARFITSELAGLMAEAGFKTFYLGFESVSRDWQNRTGAKVFSDELANAAEYLKDCGAEAANITAYQILGHPHSDIQQLEESMRFVNSLGIRGMLADFSPIPGTIDGDSCSKWVDMSEPLMHNKTAFAILLLGFEKSNRLKDMQRQLNRSLRPN